MPASVKPSSGFGAIRRRFPRRVACQEPCLMLGDLFLPLAHQARDCLLPISVVVVPVPLESFSKIRDTRFSPEKLRHDPTGRTSLIFRRRFRCRFSYWFWHKYLPLSFFAACCVLDFRFGHSIHSDSTTASPRNGIRFPAPSFPGETIAVRVPKFFLCIPLDGDVPLERNRR